jgi:hypothetical protein
VDVEPAAGDTKGLDGCVGAFAAADLLTQVRLQEMNDPVAQVVNV